MTFAYNVWHYFLFILYSFCFILFYIFLYFSSGLPEKWYTYYNLTFPLMPFLSAISNAVLMHNRCKNICKKGRSLFQIIWLFLWGKFDCRLLFLKESTLKILKNFLNLSNKPWCNYDIIIFEKQFSNLEKLNKCCNLIKFYIEILKSDVVFYLLSCRTIDIISKNFGVTLFSF